jgi:hypothetical protein
MPVCGPVAGGEIKAAAEGRRNCATNEMATQAKKADSVRFAIGLNDLVDVVVRLAASTPERLGRTGAQPCRSHVGAFADSGGFRRG